MRLGFVISKSDQCVYSQDGDHFIVVTLYVDDMLLIGNSKDMIRVSKTQLSLQFEIKDLGAAKFILGMEIRIDKANRQLWLSQKKYANSILHCFNIKD